MALKILNFNVASLIDHSRRIELERILLSNNITLAFVQETHLNERCRVFLDSYTVLRNDSMQGVAVILKNNITYKVIDSSITKFPCIFIAISFRCNGDSKSLLLGSIYIPTNTASSHIIEELDKINLLADCFDGVIIGGDLNAKNPLWGDLVMNMNGRGLEKWLNNPNTKLVNIASTCPSYPGSSAYLDQFLISSHLLDYFNPNFSIKTLPTFSDHLPLLLDIRISDADIPLTEPSSFRSFKGTDWNNFREDLDLNICHNKPSPSVNLSNQEIDDYIKKLNTAMHNAVESNSNVIAPSVKKYALLPNHIKTLFKHKHAWQKRLKNIYHNNCNRISSEYKELSGRTSLLKKIIKEKVALWLNDQLKNRLSNIKPGPQAFKEINRLTGKKKKFSCGNVIVDGISFSDDSSKAVVFGDYFKDIYSAQTSNTDQQFVQEVETSVRSTQNLFPPRIFNFNTDNPSNLPIAPHMFTSITEISNIIKNLNNKKSSGPDNIPNFILRKVSHSTIEFITIIINNCLNNGYFPLDWKIATLIPIKKKPRNIDISNFRPISLLSNLGKILERVIGFKMNEHIDNTFQYIPDFQFGFKKEHSTTHALLKIHNDVTTNLRNQRSTVACCLDVEKAFDHVWILALLHKLSLIGYPPELLKILFSYMENRYSSVQIRNSKSEPFPILCGVPQGSILGPRLFNDYMYDFPHLVHNYDSSPSTALLFADDTMVYAHADFPHDALRLLKKHIEQIKIFYKKWGIKINVPKSECICFRNACGRGKLGAVRDSKHLVLDIEGNNIPFKTNIKYLGVNFTNLFKFNRHARLVKEKAIKVSNMLTPYLRHSSLQTKTKLLFYKTLIRPVLLYGFPCWFSVSKSVALELEILERKILRFCIHKNFQSRTKRYSNSTVYNEARVVPLMSYAFTLMKKTINKMSYSENELIKEVYTSQSSISWNDSYYLSPIGIELEDLTANSECTLPLFYQVPAHGNNRG